MHIQVNVDDQGEWLDGVGVDLFKLPAFFMYKGNKFIAKLVGDEVNENKLEEFILKGLPNSENIAALFGLPFR